jgi:polygalacturonase
MPFHTAMKPMAALYTLALCVLTSFRAQAAELPDNCAVLVAGAKADGVSDNTAAIQHSLDAAAR